MTGGPWAIMRLISNHWSPEDTRLNKHTLERRTTIAIKGPRKWRNWVNFGRALFFFFLTVDKTMEATSPLPKLWCHSDCMYISLILTVTCPITLIQVQQEVFIVPQMEVVQSCLTLCDPMDYIVHGILQARILEWVAFPFSRGSSQPRGWTQVSHIADGFFTSWATGKPIVPQTITYSARRYTRVRWLSRTTSANEMKFLKSH